MLLSPYGVYHIIVPVCFVRRGGELSLSVCRMGLGVCFIMDGFFFAALCLSLSLAVSFYVPPPPPPPIWGPNGAAHCSLHGNYITPVC